MSGRPVLVLLFTAVLCSMLLPACRRSRGDGLRIEAVNDSVFSYYCNGRRGRICLVRDSLWRVCHYAGDSLTDSWTLRDSVYAFDCGDLNSDTVPEIVVGVIRPTRYRPEPDKRLFIFKLYRGRFIRPLWLGSRLGLPLEAFRVERDSVPQMIHTWERSPDSSQVQVLYRLQGFGLKFVQYIE